MRTSKWLILTVKQHKENTKRTYWDWRNEEKKRKRKILHKRT